MKKKKSSSNRPIYSCWGRIFYGSEALFLLAGGISWLPPVIKKQINQSKCFPRIKKEKGPINNKSINQIISKK